jgi:hypothetical protein
VSPRRVPRSVAVLLAAAACAHGPAPVADPTSTPTSTASSTPNPTPNPTSTSTPDAAAAAAAARLAAIRAEVDALLAAQAKLFWDVWTRGAAPEPDPGAGREALFSLQTLAFVRDARSRAEGDERRALDLLHAFLVGEHLARAASAAPEPGTAAVRWGGRTVASARVPALLAGEADAPRRAALEHAWAQAERRNAPALDARWKAVAGAAARLGYPSLLALAAELRGASADALTVLAESVLATTDAAYRTLLGDVAELELGRRLAEVRGRDLPRLFRVPEEARAFPAARLASDAQGALTALGLDLAGRPGVVLDGEARPGKDPRALALAIEVPGSVRVSFTPVAGVAELRGLLHELGAAAFYAHVTAPAVEFRRLGAVTAETWAALFEGLAGDPAWLAARTSLAETHLAALVRVTAARQLHAARARAARILVEVGRAGGPAFTPAVAKAVLERAFARPVEADELELFLAERDPLLESADALRALLLAAQADAFLRTRAPAPWWRARQAGALLAAAFADGSRLDPPALARALGAATLDATALDAAARARAQAAGIRLATER